VTLVSHVVISITSVVVVRYTEEETNHGYIFVSRIKALENIATSKMSFVCWLFNTRGLVMSEEEHDEAKAVFGMVCMIMLGLFAIYRFSGI
jgi:hypothetical protein